MIESLDIDEAIEWLQQRITFSKESFIQAVKQIKLRSTKQWITVRNNPEPRKQKKF